MRYELSNIHFRNEATEAYFVSGGRGGQDSSHLSLEHFPLPSCLGSSSDGERRAYMPNHTEAGMRTAHPWITKEFSTGVGTGEGVGNRVQCLNTQTLGR